jgi:hypothetical protein
MVEDKLRYDRMLERALRGVVREALAHTAEHGLTGDHHFYLTFTTGYPGVVMPEHLRRRYPEEMTIVIQYQFYGLEVDDDRVSVTLSFNHTQERLTVPFAAITTFADPSVSFALQFQPVPPPAEEQATAPAAAQAEPVAAAGDEDEGEAHKVVTLDSFRKK